MTNVTAALILAAALVAPAAAQPLPAPELPPSLQTLAGATSAAASAKLNLLNLGHAFGSAEQFQFGIDKTPTLTACVLRELHDGQWLLGSCRDIFVLAKDGHAVAHLGGGILYNSEHGNASYTLKGGVNVGPLAHAVLVKLGDSLPGLEAVGNFRAPKFLQYIGSITTVDYSVGYRPIHSADVIGDLTHGPMANMSIPLEDLKLIQKVFGF